jgi:hypothetical protein
MSLYRPSTPSRASSSAWTSKVLLVRVLGERLGGGIFEAQVPQLA